MKLESHNRTKMIILPPEKPVPKKLANEKNTIESMMNEIKEYVHHQHATRKSFMASDYNDSRLLRRIPGKWGKQLNLDSDDEFDDDYNPDSDSKIHQSKLHNESQLSIISSEQSKSQIKDIMRNCTSL